MQHSVQYAISKTPEVKISQNHYLKVSVAVPSSAVQVLRVQVGRRLCSGQPVASAVQGVESDVQTCAPVQFC